MKTKDEGKSRREGSCVEGSSVKGSGEMIRVSALWAQRMRIVL